MTNKSIGKVGYIAIGLAVIAGCLAVSRAIFNYSKHGEFDWGKLALGIGIPILIYILVKRA